MLRVNKIIIAIIVSALSLVEIKAINIEELEVKTEDVYRYAPYVNYMATFDEMNARRMYVYGLIDPDKAEYTVGNKDELEVKLDLVFDYTSEITFGDLITILYRLDISEYRDMSGIDNKVNRLANLYRHSECEIYDTSSLDLELISDKMRDSHISMINSTDDRGLMVSTVLNNSYFRYTKQFIDTIWDNIINKELADNILNIYLSERNIQNQRDFELKANESGNIIYSELYSTILNIIDSTEIEVYRQRPNMQMPDAFNITVTECEDLIDNIKSAMEYCPNVINLDMQQLSLTERLDVFKQQHRILYSWKLDNFGDYTYTDFMYYRNNGYLLTYSKLANNYTNDTQTYLNDTLKHLNERLENNEISDYDKTIGFDIVEFEKLGDTSKINISGIPYDEFAYINMDMMDWMFHIDAYDYNMENVDYGMEFYNEEVYKNLETKADAFLKTYIDPLKSKSDYDKVIESCRIIARLAQYDYVGLKAENEGKLSDAHSIIGFLDDGKIVCDGYALTLKWILNYLDVDCVIQLGRVGVLHAWNKVKLDDNWYNLDICWADRGSGLDMSWILKSDEYFKKHKHEFNIGVFSAPSMQANKNYR